MYQIVRFCIWRNKNGSGAIQSVLLSSTGISSQLYRRSERIASDIKLLKNHEKHENILTPLNLPKCWIIAAVQITQKPPKSTVFWYESWKSICPSKNNPKMCFTSNIFGAITRKNTLVSPLLSSASINPCGGYRIRDFFGFDFRRNTFLKERKIRGV